MIISTTFLVLKAVEANAREHPRISIAKYQLEHGYKTVKCTPKSSEFHKGIIEKT